MSNHSPSIFDHYHGQIGHCFILFEVCHYYVVTDTITSDMLTATTKLSAVATAVSTGILTALCRLPIIPTAAQACQNLSSAGSYPGKVYVVDLRTSSSTFYSE